MTQFVNSLNIFLGVYWTAENPDTSHNITIIIIKTVNTRWSALIIKYLRVTLTTQKNLRLRQSLSDCGSSKILWDKFRKQVIECQYRVPQIISFLQLEITRFKRSGYFESFYHIPDSLHKDWLRPCTWNIPM